MKRISSDLWVRVAIVGILVLNLIGLMIGVVDAITFNLLLQLLAGLSLMWSAWREYQREKRFEGMMILYVAIGAILLGQFVFGLVF